MTLIQLVYVSAAIQPFSQGDLRELLSKSRANNRPVGVTGLLLYHQQSFFQILEGPAETVTALFARIGRDQRHGRVLLLAKKHVEERSFGDWSMGFVDLEHAADKLPGS